MKKKDPKRPRTTPRPREFVTNGGRIDWTPIVDATHEVVEWALDIAARLTRDYPEELESVENVRRFVRAQQDGRPGRVQLDDVLFTITVIIGAIERDLGGGGLGGTAPASPAMAARPIAPIVPLYDPRRRNGGEMPRPCVTRPACVFRAPAIHLAA